MFLKIPPKIVRKIVKEGAADKKKPTLPRPAEYATGSLLHKLPDHITKGKKK